jgi:hypothetical protein
VATVAAPRPRRRLPPRTPGASNTYRVVHAVMSNLRVQPTRHAMWQPLRSHASPYQSQSRFSCRGFFTNRQLSRLEGQTGLGTGHKRQAFT